VTPQDLAKLNERYEARLEEELRDLAVRLGEAVVRAGQGGVIPYTRRAKEAIKRALWEEVRAYFAGADRRGAVDMQRPTAPFTRLLVDGIREGTRMAAIEQGRLVWENAPSDVAQWLTGGMVREIFYEPYHLFVYGDEPYVLSDRVWETAQTTRTGIDAILDVQIAKGTAAVDVADMLVRYLVPSEVGRLTWTPWRRSGPLIGVQVSPFGQKGNYAARRLARTEITAALGRSTINYAQVNPFIDLVEWRLSGSHPRIDICDEYAAKGPYLPANVPPYPPHPHCLCSLLPRVTRSPGQIVDDIRARMIAPEVAAPGPGEIWPGMLNTEALLQAMLNGDILAWIGL
jgi:hypothetical protein